MYHRVRRKMHWHYTFIAILIFDHIETVYPKSIDSTESVSKNNHDYSFDNNIIDFDSAYDDKFSKKYGITPWNSGNNFNKESHRYTVIPEINKDKKSQENSNDKIVEKNTTTTTESSDVPKELISTTEDVLIALIESTAVPDLTVIPLSTTQKTTTTGIPIEVVTATLPTSTQNSDTSTNVYFETTESVDTNTTDLNYTEMINTTKRDLLNHSTTTYKSSINETEITPTKDTKRSLETTTLDFEFLYNTTDNPEMNNATVISTPGNQKNANKKDLKTNATNKTETISRIDDDSSEDTDVPIFTELDLEDAEVLEDYYDGKDVVPTKPPNNDALSVIFGLAGSVVESMAERVVPKGIFDLFKRMQKQNEALEAERLRSREENGGLGQFGRGILKSISTGLSKPFTQLMESTRDKGSLDSDRGFVASVASGVSSVATAATSLVDQFKTRVQAIYPGTIWCGDGHSAQARSSDLGLFFFTDTCCRQHDACKLYIRSGDTKYGLTNTGLFTRSHCSCDANFRKCLLKTNSLVSGQIGLTYFNVLGPQCFRKAHPIVRCVRRTRITGQKCEEYELDYTKPKMWQWFDNETF